MRDSDIHRVWPLLKKQVRSLRVPWLEIMAAGEKDLFKILISCILSLRTQDKTTGVASQKLFALASGLKMLRSTGTPPRPSIEAS